MQKSIGAHFNKLGILPLKTVVSIKKGNDVIGSGWPMSDGFILAIDLLQAAPRTYVIGNGGSAAIASHMAEDYTKNGGIRMSAFNDAALLTCFANDYGYERMFEMAVENYMDEGDLLVAISSSGKSPNILNGVYAAKVKGCQVITFSGFKSDNPLRQLGDLNFYVPDDSYGNVEITHLSLLHGILDFICEDKK